MEIRSVDLMIVGGGINGAGIANEASARGLSVALCEQNDLASGTSSSSTKLIHGGLRYLEHYAFRLVRESLREREILLKKAPHLVRPMTFYMPDTRQLRSPWLIRLGLLCYDHLAGRQRLASSKRIHFSTDSATNPLNLTYRSGFSYSDCTVDDSRLVIANALAAQAEGGLILPQHICVEATREEEWWNIILRSKISGELSTIRAKVLVNATGPWASDFIQQQLQLDSHYQTRLVKGSHIVTPRLYSGNQAYLLQNKDGRVVFVIPYQKYFSMIGTTDVAYYGDPADVQIEADEIHYLCESVSRYFHKRVQPRDIVGAWSGVRALLEGEIKNPSKISREYRLDYQSTQGEPPLLSVFGGKLTTYRALAVQAVDKLKPAFPSLIKSPPPEVPLPGGDILEGNMTAFVQRIQSHYPWLPPPVAYRYAYAYGSRLPTLLGTSSNLGDLGEHFGHGLFEREIQFLKAEEWAYSIDDILWRRTKLGLLFSRHEKLRLEEWEAN